MYLDLENLYGFLISLLFIAIAALLTFLIDHISNRDIEK
jgi:hypothetical protein